MSSDDDRFDYDDFVDCYDCMKWLCDCRETEKNGPTALAELDESTRPTTMALALTRAGVVDGD